MAAQLVRPTDGRALRMTEMIAWSRPANDSGGGGGADGRSPGSQTSQHDGRDPGGAASPKWRRIAARRQGSPSTYAQISRYWRQRMRMPSSIDARQRAAAARS